MTTNNNNNNNNNDHHHNHQSIVLFYKYFIPDECPSCFQEHKEFFVDQIHDYQKDLCFKLHLKGRILISFEGINGTLSGRSKKSIQQYIDAMESFDLLRDCAATTTTSPSSSVNNVATPEEEDSSKGKIFSNIDWKKSSVSDDNNNDNNNLQQQELFPDIKISIVKEIVSTGGLVRVDEIPKCTGKHLSPKEFHEALTQQHVVNKNKNNTSSSNEKQVVLIDVRNTFEHDIGHFVMPTTGEAAMNPEMVTFSSFDTNFCAKNAEILKDKKVLMYCTGGIRCEKASVMLRKRGVEDVNQLSGGIHRYLEEYGSEGYYKGLNFVFDQRVAMKPTPPSSSTSSSPSMTTQQQQQNKDYEVVGKCIECQTPFDEICGSRICTVCRDLVLVCPKCQSKLLEYHCKRHSDWKDCYYTFLEKFDLNQLLYQKQRLLDIHKTIPSGKQKNKRRTLSRQIDKISKQISKLENGKIIVNKDAPSRCRTCMEPNSICDGRCWGFWKTKRSRETSSTKNDDPLSCCCLPPLRPVAVGDIVEPGEHWSTLRLGEKHDKATGMLRKGEVVEVRCWAGGDEMDCVAVLWDGMSHPRGRNQDYKIQPQIYRWGVIAVDGTRMYDVQHVAASSNNQVDD